MADPEKPASPSSQEIARLLAQIVDARLDASSTQIENKISMRVERNRGLFEGVRGLLLINGGAAVALLAFLQAAWEDIQLVACWLLVGLFSYSLGAASAAVIGILRYHSAFHPNALARTSNPWWWAQVVGQVLSVTFFVLGTTLAIIGVGTGLTPD